jgi:hypothetical protein
MPSPAATSAMTAQALRIHTMALMTARNMPSWSSTVSPSMSCSSSRAWIPGARAMSSTVTVAIAKLSGTSSGTPLTW